MSGKLDAPMCTALFLVRRGGRAWIVEEVRSREIGGIFTSLVAALDFVEGASRRFAETCTVVEPSADGDISTTRRAS
jgi:hypothetical protein